MPLTLDSLAKVPLGLPFSAHPGGQPMALSDFLKLDVQVRVQDKLCSFGLHYEVTSGASLNEQAYNLCAGWETKCLTTFLDLLAADVTYEGCYARSLQKDFCLPHAQAGESQVGTSGTESCPANMCLVITLQHSDAVALRSGRVYVSGVAKENLTDGRWDGTWLTNNVKPFRDKLIETITEGGTTLEPRMIQRIQGGIPIAPVGLALVSTRATDIPYTQRRRTTRQLGWYTAPA